MLVASVRELGDGQLLWVFSLFSHRQAQDVASSGLEKSDSDRVLPCPKGD